MTILLYTFINILNILAVVFIYYLFSPGKPVDRLYEKYSHSTFKSFLVYLFFFAIPASLMIGRFLYFLSITLLEFL